MRTFDRFVNRSITSRTSDTSQPPSAKNSKMSLSLAFVDRLNTNTVRRSRSSASASLALRRASRSPSSSPRSSLRSSLEGLRRRSRRSRGLRDRDRERRRSRLPRSLEPSR